MNTKDLELYFTYHQPIPESIAKMQEVRVVALELSRLINISMPDCADKSAAIRLLRECSMTTNAGIILNQSSKKDT